MTLVPSSATPAEDAVQYHISVRVNCFSPSFWITTVLKMGPDSSEYVGEFEYVFNVILPSIIFSPFTEQDGLLERKTKHIVYSRQRIQVEGCLQGQF
jgi:hypothetical protein